MEKKKKVKMTFEVTVPFDLIVDEETLYLMMMGVENSLEMIGR